MKGTTFPSKNTDRGGVEPQLVSQDVQFELFAPEKRKLDVLRRHAHPSPISFGMDELAMLHAIARHAGAYPQTSLNWKVSKGWHVQTVSSGSYMISFLDYSTLLPYAFTQH